MKYDLSSLLFTLLLLSSFAACKQKPAVTAPPPINQDTVSLPQLPPPPLSIDSVWAHNYQAIADSIMPAHKSLVQYYLRKYLRDSCGAVLLDSAAFRYNEGVQPFGRIRVGKPPVSVFVWPQINWCDMEGDAYYFTDTTLPRLETESACCHPDELFLVGDIDEDGISEIGQYYSSCVSHYKSLHVYSLKHKKWKEVGQSVFDQHYMGYEKGFECFVRKTGKGKFEMLQVTDLTDKKKIGKRDWLKYSF